jgi:hypothetical protein
MGRSVATTTATTYTLSRPRERRRQRYKAWIQRSVYQTWESSWQPRSLSLSTPFFFLLSFNLNGLVGYYVSSNLNQTHRNDCRRLRCQLQQYACGCAASLSLVPWAQKAGGQRDAAFDTNGPLHRIKSLTYRPLSGRRAISFILLPSQQPAPASQPATTQWQHRQRERGWKLSIREERK